MRNYFIVLMASGPFFLFAQSFRPGISLTYISNSNVPVLSVRYDEFTLNINGLYSINNTHNIGVQYLNIWTSGSAYNFSDEKNSYFLAGAFYQYNLLPQRVSRLFPELSINYGNYCPCGRLDPYEKPGLIYLGFGMGLDYKIYKNLFIDFGFHVYKPIAQTQDIEYVHSYTQYILGFSYLLN